jgi:hypothetical protein
LIVLELAVRLIYPKVNVSFLEKEVFVEDSLLGYRLRPNIEIDKVVLGQRYITRSNSKGLRNDVDYSYNASDNTFRILGLGDSVAYGFGVNIEDSYLKVLERKFKQALYEKGRQAEVINAAFPGWGIAQELLFLKSEGLKYNPHMVIVGFVSDDIYRNDRYYDHAMNYDLCANKKPIEDVSALRSDVIRANSMETFLLDHTRAYPFILAKFKALRNKQFVNYCFMQTQNLFKEMKGVCDKNNVTFIIAVLPIRYQENHINSLMIDFFKNEHIAFIDLSREFTSIDEEIFLENDNHPNPKGHKLIADNIYQYLVKN